MKMLTLGTKVLLLLLLALAFTGAMAAVGFHVKSTLGAMVDEYSDERIPSVQALAGLGTLIAEASGQAAAVENQNLEEAAHAAALKDLSAAVKAALEEARNYEKARHSAAELASWAETRKGLEAWAGNLTNMDDAARKRASLADNFAEAAAAQHEVSEHFDNMRKDAQSLVKQLTESARLARESADALNAESDEVQVAASRWLMASLILAALVLGSGGIYIALSTRKTLATLKREAQALRDSVSEGRLKARADATSVDAEFRPIIIGMNETMDAFTRPIRVTAECITRIGRGDIPPPIAEAYRGDFNEIKEALNGCIAAVNALVTDTRTLAQAGVQGHLDTRVDASRHQGDFRKVVQGVNDTLDAVVGPLRVAAETVDALSRGNVPPRITAEYQGDFTAIRDNLNRCIVAVNLLVTDAQALATAGAEGRLSTRADASQHQGDFRKVVEGVNRTLDAVVGPIDTAARVVAELAAGRVPPRIDDGFQGEFSRLRDNLNTCLDAVDRLVADADGLVKAATAGQLSYRADASRHQGDFAKIVDGVNRTLDAVTAPITEASGVLEKLAARDLCAQVEGTYQGDHARIKAAVNSTGAALREALTQVARAVEQVSSAAAQIASSSQAVASGASEQASALSETGTSIESVAAMTRRSAENAQQANVLATAARSAAGAGTASVEQLQGAMAQIRVAADRTGQIIKDVSDIAFQTNLLALNAAVEAARAGEAGRGFAVVAEEVRSLALRAKEAAGKTEELIRESVRQAGQGETAAGQVSAQLSEIVQGVSKVSDIVAEIAASAREQTSGITQVNSAIGEMDKVTQQNAASAEESSSAASELNAQAEELASMVGSFRLETDADQRPEAVRRGNGVAKSRLPLTLHK